MATILVDNKPPRSNGHATQLTVPAADMDSVGLAPLHPPWHQRVFRVTVASRWLILVEFTTPVTVRSMVRVRDCEIVWVDGWTWRRHKCIFRHFLGVA